MTRITNFLFVIWMKKDTQCFHLHYPKLEFPLEGHSPFFLCAEKSHAPERNNSKQEKNPKSLPYFLDLPFSEIQFRAMTYRQKRRQRNYWSSSSVCVCMSCGSSSQPAIITLHREQPALPQPGAPALLQGNGCARAERCPVPGQSSGAWGGLAKGKGQRGKGQLCREKVNWGSAGTAWPGRSQERRWTRELGQNKLPVPAGGTKVPLSPATCMTNPALP